MFERFDELKPGIGGGIQINGGAAVLSRLGLGDQVKASVLPVRRILSRKSGRFELLDIDVESLVSAESGTPQAFSIMRDAPTPARGLFARRHLAPRPATREHRGGPSSTLDT